MVVKAHCQDFKEGFSRFSGGSLGSRLIVDKMAKKSSKFLITTETFETTVVRPRGAIQFRRFCPECDTDVRVVTLEHAVALSGYTGGEIVRRIGSGSAHFVELPNGPLYVCMLSLNGGKNYEN